MSVIGKHAISETTPQDILLGAGTWLRGLEWNTETQSWDGEVLGATSGGGKISIVGEFYEIPVDGMLVPTKGFTVKNGGAVTTEVNFIELSTAVVKMATLFEEGESDAPGFTMLQDKAAITDGDYVQNFGFVGKTTNGAKDIIFIMENGLCTSGMELEPKNKEAAVTKLTLKAYAENQGDLDVLPVKIYYPETVRA